MKFIIKKSFDNYKDHIVYCDSINSIHNVQKMANVRTDYEVSQKQIEVDLLNQEKKIQQSISSIKKKRYNVT